MKLIEVYKALSDISRIKILNILLEEELCVCEIETVLEMSQSNVSRHLNKLKQADMVDFRKESQWVYYSIGEEFINKYPELFNHLKKSFAEIEELVVDKHKLIELKQQGSICN
jgi:ArsR family transcriptional regulator